MKNFFYLILSLLGGAAVASCDPEGVVSDDDFGLYPVVEVEHGMMELGEKLEDPYTVANMTRALVSLYPTKARVDLKASDLYVRFLPLDEQQLDVLSDMGLEMLDHPVDYRVLREGDYYHDPSVPPQDITWQYAVVPSDFHFPSSIRYEVLDECYLAENVPTRAADVDWTAVEKESYRLTGNGDAWQEPTRGRSSGRPSGRITIVDESLEGGTELGVAGVEVAVNSFVKVAVGYTDAEGRYSIDRSYASRLRYRIVFKNKKGFGIGMNLLLIPASVSTLGAASPDGLSVKITSSSDRKLFTRCVANNAAYDYFEYCNADDSGVKAPPADLRMWLLEALSSSSAPMARQGTILGVGKLGEILGEYSSLLDMFLPDITIGTHGLQKYAPIYSLVWHELSHASHFEKVGKEYWSKYISFIISSFLTSGGMTYGTGHEEGSGYCEVGESWAYYMQTLLMNTRYGMTDYTAGSTYWFHPQILLYMGERGLTPGRIFRALDESVVSGEDLKVALLALYPEFKTVIRQAFERYE